MWPSSIAIDRKNKIPRSRGKFCHQLANLLNFNKMITWHMIRQFQSNKAKEESGHSFIIRGNFSSVKQIKYNQRCSCPTKITYLYNGLRNTGVQFFFSCCLKLSSLSEGNKVVWKIPCLAVWMLIGLVRSMQQVLAADWCVSPYSRFEYGAYPKTYTPTP